MCTILSPILLENILVKKWVFLKLLIVFSLLFADASISTMIQGIFYFLTVIDLKGFNSLNILFTFNESHLYKCSNLIYY